MYSELPRAWYREQTNNSERSASATLNLSRQEYRQRESAKRIPPTRRRRRVAEVGAALDETPEIRMPSEDRGFPSVQPRPPNLAKKTAREPYELDLGWINSRASCRAARWA